MTAVKTEETQQRAMAREDSNGTPYARTRNEARVEAAELAELLDHNLGRRVRAGTVTVATWLGAHGDSYCLHLEGADDGLRVALHRWHSTGEVEVRAVNGSFWRPRSGREGIQYGREVVAADAPAEALGEAALRMAAVALAPKS